MRIPPSPDAGDAAFLRRAYLDATGTLPPSDRVEAFSKDRDPHKRVKLVDRLLDSKEYVDYWAYKWSDVLLVSSRKLPAPVDVVVLPVRAAERGEEPPWDRFARSIVTAQGSTLTNGAANFLCPAPRPDRPVRKREHGVPRPVADLCAVSQPSAGKMDAGPVLRLRQPVRPGEAQGR